MSHFCLPVGRFALCCDNLEPSLPEVASPRRRSSHIVVIANVRAEPADAAGFRRRRCMHVGIHPPNEPL